MEWWSNAAFRNSTTRPLLPPPWTGTEHAGKTPAFPGDTLFRKLPVVLMHPIGMNCWRMGGIGQGCEGDRSIDFRSAAAGTAALRARDCALRTRLRGRPANPRAIELISVGTWNEVGFDVRVCRASRGARMA